MQRHHHRHVQSLVFVIVGMVLLSILASAGVTWASPPSQGGCTVPPCRPPIPVTGGGCCLPGVAFTTTRDGNEEVYVMRADGSGPTRLTTNPAVDRHPAPSPDGKLIAFESTRDDPDPLTCGQPGKPNCISHIYAMNVDGTGLVRLTTGRGYDSFPSWANDGTRIAFVTNVDDPNYKTCGQPGNPACVTQIYVMSADGYWVRRVTGEGVNSSPNWSPYPPEDTRIAFVSNRDGNEEIYVMDIAFLYDRDGNESMDLVSVKRLTNHPASDGHPGWSPDGTQLVFESNRDGHYQLYIMNADGTHVTRITNTDSLGTLVATKALSEDRYPIWIPACSERIVFSSNRTGEYRIFAVDPNGMNPSQLTIPLPSVAQVDLYPAWSGLPDHLRAVEGACCIPGIAFDSLRDGIEEVYVMRADGFRLTPLTLPPNHPGRNMFPAPSRDGTKIAFQSNRDGRFQLYWIPVTGGPAVRLTNSSGNDTSPMWSNSGRYIAFVSTRDGPNSQLYVMDVDPATLKPTGERRFTADPNRIDNNPSWFPRDDRIVFQSKVGTGNDDVYLINSDGSELRQLTKDPANDGHPTISSDAQWIAFESNRTGKYQIYVMRTDGSDVKQITSEGENRQPYWCPSCLDRIVFSSDRKGDGFRIYTMNGDGGNQVRLTSLTDGSAKPDHNPAWSGLPLPAFPPAATLAPARERGGARVLVGWLGGLTSGIRWPRGQQ